MRGYCRPDSPRYADRHLGKWGYAYVIALGETGLFKVGHTDDLDERLRAHSTISPEPLSYYATIESDDCSAIEKVMKDYLEEYRVPGIEAREMFKPPLSELDDAIALGREWNVSMLPLLAEAEEARLQACDFDRALDPSEEHWALYRELLRLRQVELRAVQGQTWIAARLQVDMGTAWSLDGIATWKSGTRATLDRKALLTDHPHLESLLDEYTTRKHWRRFLPRW